MSGLSLIERLSSINLAISWIAALGIIAVTAASRTADRRLRLAWIAMNASIGWWAFWWWMGAFILPPPGDRFGQRMATTPTIMLPICFLYFVEVYLGKRPTRLFKIVAVGSLLFMALCLIWPDGLLPYDYIRGHTHLPHGGPLMWVFAGQFYTLQTLGVIWLALGLRTQSPEQRNRTIYILLGCAIGSGGGGTTFLPALGLPIYPVGVIVVPVYSAMITHAILRHRLLDIQIVFRKTLLYSALTATLTSFYFVLLFVLVHSFQNLLHLSGLGFAMVAAAATTFLFHPLQEKFQAVIDRRFFRDRGAREKQLAALSGELFRQESVEAMTQVLGRFIDDTLHPKGYAIYLQSLRHREWLRQCAAGPVASSLPVEFPPDHPWVVFCQRAGSAEAALPEDLEAAGLKILLPLATEEEIFGCLLLTEKKSEQTYSPEDRTFLQILANQAAVAYDRPRRARAISGGFVHEIKTPLTNITLPAQTTLMEFDRLADGRTKLEDALPRLRRLQQHIVDQAMIAAQRVDALEHLNEMQRESPEPVDVAAVLERSLRAWAGRIEELNVGIEKKFAPGLPVITGYAAELDVVFVNFIKNALEAMSLVQGDRRLEIVVRVDGAFLRAEVADSGSGMSADVAGRIFQPGFSTKGTRGRGVGLFLVRKILRAHEATIEVISKPGAGARFIVRFPLIFNPIRLAS